MDVAEQKSMSVARLRQILFGSRTEKTADVLKHRAQELPPPIPMCDALSRNLPRDLLTVLANCLAHARRKFVEVAPSFKDECKYVLESIGAVYRLDAQARQSQLTPDERLEFHQAPPTNPWMILHRDRGVTPALWLQRPPCQGFRPIQNSPTDFPEEASITSTAGR